MDCVLRIVICDVSSSAMTLHDISSMEYFQKDSSQLSARSFDHNESGVDSRPECTCINQTCPPSEPDRTTKFLSRTGRLRSLHASTLKSILRLTRHASHVSLIRAAADRHSLCTIGMSFFQTCRAHRRVQNNPVQRDEILRLPSIRIRFRSA